MRPSASGLLKRVALRACDQTATVYTRDATPQKQYTVVAMSGLKCNLQPVNRSTAPTGPDRADLANLAVLRWDPSYEMPEFARVVISSRPGETYQVRPGTITPDVGAGGVVVLRHCDVERVK
jgi:hypothetical protein